MSGSSPPSERRKEARKPIELKVEYKRLNTLFADYTRNISRGGTFIRTKSPLRVGTEFVFALSAPALSAPVRLIGRVQWVRTEAEATDDRPAGMGIAFIFSSDDERRSLEQQIEQLMVSEFGDELSAKLLGRTPRKAT